MNMKTFGNLSREVRYALFSAVGAGLFSFLLIVIFFSMLNWLFIPVVMLMVYLSAYFAFKRRASGKGELGARKIFSMALEVGTITHFTTFAVFLPINYFIFYYEGLTLDVFLSYISITLLIGFVSLILLGWLAVPMYIGIGYLIKSTEKDEDFSVHELNDSILDDDLSREQGREAMV